MRLIDADDLMEQIRLMANRTSLGEITLPSIGGLEIVGLIMKAPTIETVPVDELRKSYYYMCAAMRHHFTATYPHLDDVVDEFCNTLQALLKAEPSEGGTAGAIKGWVQEIEEFERREML